MISYQHFEHIIRPKCLKVDNTIILFKSNSKFAPNDEEVGVSLPRVDPEE
jgi:hypothetical protein